MSAFPDASTDVYDTQVTNIDSRALMKAGKSVNSNVYDADTAIICYEAEYHVRSNTYVLDLNVPRISGMDLFTYEPVKHIYDSDTYAWGYENDREIGMFALDAQSLCGFIGMRLDIPFGNDDTR